jgi:hypothetical protein
LIPIPQTRDKLESRGDDTPGVATFLFRYSTLQIVWYGIFKTHIFVILTWKDVSYWGLGLLNKNFQGPRTCCFLKWIWFVNRELDTRVIVYSSQDRADEAS